MKRFSPIRWFRDVSIKTKLYFTVGIMATLIAIELAALAFSIHTLSSVRAYVNGEALWSKSQKDAMYTLINYARTKDETEFAKFKQFLRVPLGDHAALVELGKPKDERNFETIKRGFIEGRNHPDDVQGMVNLFSRFYWNYYIDKAIHAWIGADSTIPHFIILGDKLHEAIIDPQNTQARTNAIFDEIEALNAVVTKYEDEFSYQLGEGSRWLEKLILKILLGIALTVEATGLILAIVVSRSISRGLDAIFDSADAVAKGDFSVKAKVFSKDEIGTLAHKFNTMASELEQLQNEIKDNNVNLEKTVELRTAELERKNKELEQFAYVASHDLQEPLKTVSGFVGLLRKQYQGRLDENADRYLAYIVQASDRMKTLIKDLLDYSRIGRAIAFVKADCNILLHEVLADMNQNIRENKAVVKADDLPVLYAYPTELKLLFQNLISNAIKFKKPGAVPEVNISISNTPGFWRFAVSDNGIGIDQQHRDRIFIIFQRLHNRKDYEGSGIGLAHCKKIVELHGGEIWVESTPGKGSTFFFTIAELPFGLQDEN
ncbi:HAMP domain-containing protein [Pseudoflavitalea sp. G-6-1-2]|uniref:sensor histidine kinase n=1 Tax=Pseudoflavitalea sp. G-6-1-2 TaxID=2728841 RepID=UPI00146E79C8|nr:ATP-binding protein [Pseudoflavitalea sp. G-6-1-2]NML21573.1 HAMP domain-containing protein [Pseudoflavitalea sp. G-6-1-2]